MMNTKSIIGQVEEKDSFLTLEELDKIAFAVSEKYGFEIREIGKSENGHPIWIIKVGEGKKNAFVWGFPHPNEPIGSLTIDFLIRFFGDNQKELEKTGFTWYFIYTADPDGTRLNEGWFKGKTTIRKYFHDYYRPAADRQLEWTFPVKYKDFSWNTPTAETKVLMKFFEEVKIDLMYPLHNAGFGGAYFLANKKFDDEYYDKIIKHTLNLEIPLHLGEPEEEFMKEIRKPFYLDFGFKEYYEEAVKHGKNPRESLKHGDNSTHYLMNLNPNSITIKGEVPYFFVEDILDNTVIDKTRRKIWLEMTEKSDDVLNFCAKFIPKILEKLDKKDPYYFLAEQIERRIKIGNEGLRSYIKSSKEFERNSTKSEKFSTDEGYRFYNGLSVAQLKRAAIRAKIEEKEIKDIEEKIEEIIRYIENKCEIKTIPIKKLIQLQLIVLFESLNYLERSA